MEERLHKYLARSGIASRRKAEEYITKGFVTVNGRKVTEMGHLIDPDTDKVSFKGKPVHSTTEKIFLLLNKPPGYITTTSDPEKRPTVMDLISGIAIRLFPVGRLDSDSEGLLLLTNDGEMANRLAHPRYGIKKTYRVHIRGRIENSQIKRLEKGVILEDGITAPAKVTMEYLGRIESKLLLQIAEGKKRQIRRMMDEVGHPVNRLIRIQYGPIVLGKLRSGEYRYLSALEIRELRKTILTG
jgi:23S rRNA pseudouridine2605 synthase